MSNTPHTLRDEFPDQMEAIHALKTTSRTSRVFWKNTMR